MLLSHRLPEENRRDAHGFLGPGGSCLSPVPQTLTTQVVGRVAIIGPSVQRKKPRFILLRWCGYGVQKLGLETLSPSCPLVPPHCTWMEASYPPRAPELQAPCTQGLLGPGWLSRDTLAFVSAQPAGWAASREERGCSNPARPGTNAQREIEAPLLWLSVGEGCCQLPPHVMTRPSPSQRFAHHPRGPAGSLSSPTSSRSCASPSCFIETLAAGTSAATHLVCCGPTVCHRRARPL